MIKRKHHSSLSRKDSFNTINCEWQKREEKRERTDKPKQKMIKQTSINMMVELHIRCYIPTIHPCKRVERKGEAEYNCCLINDFYQD